MVSRAKRISLSNSLSKVTRMSEKECSHQINTLFKCIIDLLSDGSEVKVGDFGVFKVSVIKEHVGRNPRTGESVNVPEKKKVVFSPSKNMVELVSEKPFFDGDTEVGDSDESEDGANKNMKLITEPNLRIKHSIDDGSNSSFDF